MARRKKTTDYDSYKQETVEHNSVLDFAEYASEINLDANNAGSRRNKEYGFNDGTWDEAVDRVRHGESERVALVVDAANAVKREVEQVIFRKKHDVAGSYLDIGRYLDGEPECFVRRMRNKQERKIVTIGINSCASWMVKPEQLRNRGGAIVALIDSLLDAGVIVEVVIDMQVINRYKAVKETHLINLDANNLDVDALAYALTSADFFRRFGFAAIERMLHKHNVADPVSEALSDGYGATITTPPKTKQYNIYCSGVSSDNMKLFNTAESSARWVTSLIERYNAGEEEMIVA